MMTPNSIAFPTLVEKLLPTGLVGLVFAGLVAAVMSHVSGAINSCTTIASVDFYLPYINKDASEAQVVRFGKIFGMVVVALGIFWAWILISHSDKPIFIYLMNAYGYFAPGIAAMFLLGILWKRATYAGALAAGALTVPLSAGLDLAIRGIPFANRSGIVFWACIVLGIIVSLLTKPKAEADIKGLIWNRESLILNKEERSMMAGIRNPAIWWTLVTALVVLAYIKYW